AKAEYLSCAILCYAAQRQRDVNVGRVVFNLGGGGVVGLRCDGEDQHYSLEHGDGYYMGPIASGKAPVSNGLFCRHSVGIQPGFRQPLSGLVATCSLVLDVHATTWSVRPPPPPSPLPLPVPPRIWKDWVALRDSLQACLGGTAEVWREKAAREEADQPPTPRDTRLQAAVQAGGRATGVVTAKAWREKAAREEADQPPTPRDTRLQAAVQAGGRATGVVTAKAWREKAAREEADQPPTPRDTRLQAAVQAGGRAAKEKAARDMAARERSWQDLLVPPPHPSAIVTCSGACPSFHLKLGGPGGAPSGLGSTSGTADVAMTRAAQPASAAVSCSVTTLGLAAMSTTRRLDSGQPSFCASAVLDCAGEEWLDRDTNGWFNLQRIGENMQRSLELCSYEGLEVLPPVGKEYQQGYKRKYCSEKGLALENSDNPSHSATLVLCYLANSNARLWQLRCSPDRTHPPSEELELLESQELDIPALKRLSTALELGFEEAQAAAREHGAVNRLVDYALYLQAYKGLRCKLSQNDKRHVPGRLINAGMEEKANPMRDKWEEMMAKRAEQKAREDREIIEMIRIMYNRIAPPAQAQALPAAPGPVQRPQAPPWGRWLDRDTNGWFNLQRIGENMQRSLELCSYEGLEVLPPVGKEYQQGYKRKYCSEKGLALENSDNPSHSATLVLCYLANSNARLWQLRCSPDRTHPPSEELELLESQELDIPALKRLSTALELGFEEAQAAAREHGAVNRLVDYALYLQAYKGLRCKLSQNAKRHVPGRLINAGMEEKANPMRDKWEEMMAKRAEQKAREDREIIEMAPPAQAQALPAAPGPVQRPQAPPWGRWLDRDTNGWFNLQRIGENMQRSLELCSYEGLEVLPPVGKEYQQGYKRKYCSEKGLALENSDNPSHSATLVLCYLANSNARLWQLRCSPDRTHPPSEELELLESQELDIPALKRLSTALELGFEEAQAAAREHGAVNRLVDYALYLQAYKGLRCKLSQNAKRQ
ncbi:hypothetical protein QJQ45_023680, partial [Haematococcus lacustris]